MTGKLPVGLFALLLCSVSGHAVAQDSQAARIAALEQQIAALAAQVAELKKSVAVEPKPAPAKPDAAVVTIAAGKPVIASSDGAFSINFHAIAQLDTASYFQDAPANGSVIGPDLDGGANFRRARLSVDGKLFRDFDYGLMVELAGQAQLHEAYVQYSGLKLGDQALRLRAGAFAPNVGLHDAASQGSALLLERSSAAEIARNLAAGDRRVGLQIATNTDRWLGAVAITGGKLSNGAVIDEQTAYTARFVATPLIGEDWRLHLGANTTYVARPPQVTALGGATGVTLSDRPELRNDATALVATGALTADHVRLTGLEAAYQNGPLLLQSEAMRFDLDRGAVGKARFGGYYLEGSWLLTGETRRYNPATGAFDAPRVARVFDLSKGQWGAWELAARYSFMDLDFNDGAAGAATPVGGVRGGEQKILAGAINWQPNSAVRLTFQYQDVAVDRLNAAGTLQVGQDYSTAALRSQFAF